MSYEYIESVCDKVRPKKTAYVVGVLRSTIYLMICCHCGRDGRMTIRVTKIYAVDSMSS